MKYTEHLVNSFLTSNHTGTISGADVVARVVDKNTGDAVKLFMVIEDGIIKNAKFQACGSVVLFASMSAIVDLIIEKTVDEASLITEKQIIKEIKQVNRCDYSMVTFAVKALNAAIATYHKKLKKIDGQTPVVIKNVRVRAIAPASDISVYGESVEKPTIETILEESKKADEPKPVEPKIEDSPATIVEEQEETPLDPELLESVPTKIEVRIMEEELVGSTLEEEKISDSESQENKKSDDVIDEIDSITAKLTDAITKLNFKFDVDGEIDE